MLFLSCRLHCCSFSTTSAKAVDGSRLDNGKLVNALRTSSVLLECVAFDHPGSGDISYFLCGSRVDFECVQGTGRLEWSFHGCEYEQRSRWMSVVVRNQRLHTLSRGNNVDVLSHQLPRPMVVSQVAAFHCLTVANPMEETESLQF